MVAPIDLSGVVSITAHAPAASMVIPYASIQSRIFSFPNIRLRAPDAILNESRDFHGRTGSAGPPLKIERPDHIGEFGKIRRKRTNSHPL